MNSWVDYYNNRAITYNDIYEISEMSVGSSIELSKLYLEEDRERLYGLLNPKKNFSLLDLGCCVGVFLEIIKDNYSKILGVDLAENAVKIAQERLPACHFLTADISKPLTQIKDKYDHIISFGVMHYLSDSQIDGFLNNIKTLLHSGGKAAVLRIANKQKHQDYQSYRAERNKPIIESDQQLQWNWIDPQYIIDHCSDDFEVIIIHPSSGSEYPFKAFFDFLLIKK